MSRTILLTVTTRSVMLVAGLASSVITARTLGPSGRGDFFFVLTLSATVVQFSNLGLHSSNTYLVARDRRLLGALLANSLWISLVVGIVTGGAAVALLAFTGLIPNAPGRFLWYAVALAPPLLFFMLGANLLVGVGRIGTFNAVEALGRLVVLAACIATALVAPSVGPFLAANALAWVLVCAGLLAVLMRLAGKKLRFNRSVFAYGFRYALKAYLVALLAFLVLRANIFLLERMSTPVEVGYFSVASQIADALAIVPTSVALVLFPNLVRNERDRWRMTMRSAAISAIALAAVCGVIAIVAGPVIRLAFGGAFAPATGILRALLPGVVALGATSIVSQYLSAIGIPRLLLGVWAATLALVVVLGYFLIRGHSGVGAAADLSITYGTLFLLVLAAAHRSRRQAERTRATDTPSVPLPAQPEQEAPWL